MNKKYEILTLYKCVKKLSMTVSCNIWMICLKLNWLFTIRVAYCSFLNLNGLNFFSISRFDQFSSYNAQQREVRSAAIKNDYFSPLAYTPFLFFANILFNYIYTAKNNRFVSLIILLLSVKPTMLKNVASMQIKKVAIYDSDRKKK